MARLILAIIAFAMAAAVLKMVILALVLAGLIFRTRVTVGLLLLGGMLTFVAAYPLVALGLATVAGLFLLVRAASSDADTPTPLLPAPDDPPQG